MGRRADSIFILREEPAGELGKKIPEPVTGPIPVSPVINELQNIRGLVDEELYTLPRRAAGTKCLGTERPAVRRFQPFELGAQNLSGENREMIEIGEALNVARLQANAVKEVPVVRHERVSMFDDSAEQLLLIVNLLIVSKPLGLLEGGTQFNECRGVGKIDGPEL